MLALLHADSLTTPSDAPESGVIAVLRRPERAENLVRGAFDAGIATSRIVCAVAAAVGASAPGSSIFGLVKSVASAAASYARREANDADHLALSFGRASGQETDAPTVKAARELARAIHENDVEIQCDTLSDDAEMGLFDAVYYAARATDHDTAIAAFCSIIPLSEIAEAVAAIEANS
jgi:hypothetical protein